jgi:fibronectin-binding autotransporter adhesin
MTGPHTALPCSMRPLRHSNSGLCAANRYEAASSAIVIVPPPGAKTGTSGIFSGFVSGLFGYEDSQSKTKKEQTVNGQMTRPWGRKRLAITLITVVGLSLLAAAGSEAMTSVTTRYWIGGDGLWSSGDNWNTDPNGLGSNGVPQTLDAVIIAGSESVVSLDLDYGIGGELSTLRISGTGFAGATLNHNLGKTLILNGGYGALIIGGAPDEVGTYNLEGGTLWSGNTYVGSSGTGIFNQTGGTHYIGVNPDDLSAQGSTHELILGQLEGSTGTYNLSGGTLYAKREIVGDAGYSSLSKGIFNQSGNSTHIVYEDLIIGQDTFSSGTFNLGNAASSDLASSSDAATFSVGGNLYLGDESGTGTFNQSGNTTLTVSGRLVIGSGSESLGGNASGTFNQYGGTTTVSSDLVLGQYVSMNGAYNLTGGTLSSGNTYVGNGGDGIFIVSGTDGPTVHNVNGNLILGHKDPTPDSLVTGNGSYTITGSAQLNVNFVTGGNGPADPEFSNGSDGNGGANPAPNGALIVGNYGSGTFVQGSARGSDSPSVAVAGDLVLGNQFGSQGTYTLNSGTLTVDGKLVVGFGSGPTDDKRNSLNVFTQSGGSVLVTGNAWSDSNYAGVGGNDWMGWLTLGWNGNSSGTYNLNGGDLTATAGGIQLGLSGTGTFNHTGGSVNVSQLWLGNSGSSAGNSAGYYNLIGDGQLTASYEGIGMFGFGSFVQNGDATVNTVNGDLVLATEPLPSYQTDAVHPRTGTYELIAGELNTINTIVSQKGIGRFIQSGGSHNISGSLTLGEQYTTIGYDGNVAFGGASQGTYDLSGGQLTVANNEWIGKQGTGSFTQSGSSTHTVGGDLVLGNDYDSESGARGNGTYDLQSGNLTVGSFSQEGVSLQSYGITVGNSGNGTFTQTGGTVKISADLNLGQMGGTNGTYNFNTGISGQPNSGSLAVGRHEHVGFSGTAIFTQGGGIHTVGGDLVLGNESTGNGTFNLNGGNVDVAGIAYVGMGGTGQFSQTGGTFRTASDLNIGQLAVSTGSFFLSETVTSNPAFLQIGRNLNVGLEGKGTFTQTGGTVTVIEGLIVGQNSPESKKGEYFLSGGSVTSGWLHVGTGDNTKPSYGSIIHTGGTNTTGDLVLGYIQQGVGTYELSNDGSLKLSYGLTIGLGGQGTFTQSGGTVWVGDIRYNREDPGGISPTGMTVVGDLKGSVGTYTLSGGLHHFGDEMVVGSNSGSTGTYNISGTGQLQGHAIYVGENGNGYVNQSGQDTSVRLGDLLVLGNKVTGYGEYTLGSGTLRVQDVIVVGSHGKGVFNQTGGTVTADQVVVASSTGSTGVYNIQAGTLTANSVTVNAGGLLKGSGTIYAPINVTGGTVAPGNSPGTLTVNGNYSQDENSTLLVELGGTGIGQYDVLQVNGDAKLAGTLKILLDGYTPTTGSIYIYDILVASGTVTGRFDTIDASTTGWNWTVDYLTSGVQLTANSAVPIPGAVWLLASGLVALVGIRRRIRR